MDKTLIEKLKKGDEKAFKSIYEQHYVFLCRFATQLLNDDSLAEEVVDDVIFYLWEHRAELEITISIRAYLIRSVRNRCLNEINSLRNRTFTSFSSITSEDNLAFWDTLLVDELHPLGRLIKQEMQDELDRCISELPNECRIVFMKSRFDGKKYAEISEELGISVNTVKYHITRALSLLQSRLGSYLKLIILYFFIEK